MKDVPFYPNHPDNKHCQSAVYRMILDYFLQKKLTWEEIEMLAGFRDGKVPWTVIIWERLSRMGFDVRVIEPFDYERYVSEGEAYLHELYSPEEAAWQLKNSNIREIKPLVPGFLKQVKPIQRSPTLADIDNMLSDGRLVMVQLNAHVLNGLKGYLSHAVLVIGKEGSDYILHDPGLRNKQAYRRVSASKLYEAMGGDDNTVEIAGVKLSRKPVRADVMLASMHPAYSRAALAKLFKEGLVTHKGKPVKSGDKLPPSSALQADISPLQTEVEDIDLPVLYEDDDCIVINKPAGVLAHAPGSHSAEPSVASFLRLKATGIEGGRAGIVHRLDRATSGVIIGAKNPEALSWLQKQFSQRKVKKTYMAVVEGTPKPAEAVIDMPIERNPKAPATFRTHANGKPAVTRYKIIKTGKNCTLLELQPETGRTHQLRVHMAKIGHLIKGDPLYGHGAHGDRLFLHAQQLEITLPNREHKTFTAPVPAEFKRALK